MIAIIIISIINLIILGGLIWLFRQYFNLKLALDDILIKIMKDHKQIIEGEKQTNKDVLVNYESANKSIKDINNIRVSINTFKELLKALNSTDNVLNENAKNQTEINKHTVALIKRLEEITTKLYKKA